MNTKKTYLSPTLDVVVVKARLFAATTTETPEFNVYDEKANGSDGAISPGDGWQL